MIYDKSELQRLDWKQ